MATTIAVIVDRVRSLCLAAPFGFDESVTFEDFRFQPAGTLGGAFRVETQGAVRSRGGFGLTEERTEALVLEVAQATNQDYDGTRRRLLQTATSLVGAIVRDGLTWGEYTVPDGGRTQSAVLGERGAAFLTTRVTVPVNYEAYL